MDKTTQLSWLGLGLTVLLGACDGNLRVPAGLGSLGLRILSPTADGVANSDRPVLEWMVVPKAVRYQLSLYDAAGTWLETLTTSAASGSSIRRRPSRSRASRRKASSMTVSTPGS